MTTAFVLTGGGSLGAVQVGMLQALAERGTRPDVLIGTSVGAINAAFVAGHGADTKALTALEHIWRSLRRGDVFPFQPHRHLLGALGRRQSLFSDAALRRLVRSHLRFSRLEDAPIPLHVTATDVLSGKNVLLSSGNALEAVMASAAIPAILPPVQIHGRLVYDGGVANNAPIAHAVALGCDRVVVLPTGSQCDLEQAPGTALGHALHAITVLIQQQLILDVAAYSDLVDLDLIPPLCPLSVSPADFRHSAELIDRAQRAAGRWLDEGGTELPRPERFLSLHRHAPRHEPPCAHGETEACPEDEPAPLAT